MPEFTTVPYRTIQHAIQPGQLVALVRADGSPRLEDWNAFKILLVLGGSSSGKTTTMAEKVLGFVIGGGLIVPCDPHETKQDSLTKKIYPLAPALYPGAVFAVEHHTILQNMRLVTAILEDRINGAESSIPVLLVVEELNRLLRDKAIAKEVSRILETLGEEGRGYNVFVLVGCQRVTYLSDIRKACISFIVHRCDESEAQLVIPQRYAKYCPELRPGQCFVKDSNGVTEAGLQALVTHQDMERASVRLTHQQIERPLQHPSVRPGLHLPQRQGYGRPTRSLSGTVDSSQRTPHKTRLQPVQPNAEESRGDTSNPLHTWTYEQPTGDTSQPESPVLPDSPSESPRITEELNPSDLSPEQQLAILVMRRKKKNPKTKENES